MGPFESEKAVGHRSVGNGVLCEESERPVQPRVTPPLPAETVTLAGPRHMVPNLLLDPTSKSKMSTRSTAVWRRKALPSVIRLPCSGGVIGPSRSLIQTGMRSGSTRTSRNQNRRKGPNSS